MEPSGSVNTSACWEDGAPQLSRTEDPELRSLLGLASRVSSFGSSSVSFITPFKNTCLFGCTGRGPQRPCRFVWGLSVAHGF